MRPNAPPTTIGAAAILAVVLAGLLATSQAPAKSSNSPEPNHELVDKIVVTSDRHAPTIPQQTGNFEIYLLKLDGSGEQRLTNNNAGDGFGALSPDGKKIVFESNRNLAEGEPANISDLFVMNADGTDQTFLTRGGSPSWSPDGNYIAFHASASGTGKPINNLPGAATEDSDIFVVNVDDLLEHGTPPRNLTNDPHHVDDDPDWSPDGTLIAYTSHDVNQRPVPPMPLDYTTAELYVRAADRTGTPTRLTNNSEEERAADWSHNGNRIAYMCHEGSQRFEFCVTDLNGHRTQLTDNNLAHLGPSWSPDDQRIFFNRPRPTPSTGNQIWWVTADGTNEQLLVPPEAPTGSTFFPNVGVLRVKTDK
jgi:Tol biopolymer transport system component